MSARGAASSVVTRGEVRVLPMRIWGRRIVVGRVVVRIDVRVWGEVVEIWGTPWRRGRRSRGVVRIIVRAPVVWRTTWGSVVGMMIIEA